MRGNFLLKESKLAAVLIKACGLDPKSSVDAQNVQNWRKHGAAQAGNFPAILEEVPHKAWPIKWSAECFPMPTTSL